MHRVIVPVEITVETDSIDAAYEIIDAELDDLVIQDMRARAIVLVGAEIEIDIAGDKTEQEAVDMAMEIVGTHHGLPIDGEPWTQPIPPAISKEEAAAILNTPF